MKWLKKRKNKQKINHLKNSINNSNDVYLILENMSKDIQFLDYLEYIKMHKKMCLNDIVENYEQIKKVVI